MTDEVKWENTKVQLDAYITSEMRTRISRVSTRLGAEEGEVARRAIAYAIEKMRPEDWIRSQVAADQSERLHMNVHLAMRERIREIMRTNGIKMKVLLFRAIRFALKNMSDDDWLSIQPGAALPNGRGRPPAKLQPVA